LATPRTNIFVRSTSETRPILTANSPPRHRPILTSRAQCFHKQCSSSSPAGLTTDRLQVLEMPAAALRTRRSKASPNATREAPSPIQYRCYHFLVCPHLHSKSSTTITVLGARARVSTILGSGVQSIQQRQHITSFFAHLFFFLPSRQTSSRQSVQQNRARNGSSDCGD
jgi:hypothetical protein